MEHIDGISFRSSGVVVWYLAAGIGLFHADMEWNRKLFYRNNTAGMEQRCCIFYGYSSVVVRHLAAGIGFLYKYLDDNDAESDYIWNCDNDHNAMAECG